MATWLVSAWILALAPVPERLAWPASAGLPPSTFNMVFRDPRARFFDPPAGRYSNGDGSLIAADPPRGYYDPPPGYYPRDRAIALEYGNPLGPLPRPLSEQEIWEKRHRQRKIALAISCSALGVAVLAPIITAIARAASPPPPGYSCIDCWDPGILVLMGLGPPAVISTTVSAILFGIHSRRRPASERVSLAPGGLRLRF